MKRSVVLSVAGLNNRYTRAWRQWFASSILAAGLLFVCTTPLPFAFITTAHAQQGPSCSGQFLIDRFLSNGARWEMCWIQRLNEGILLAEVHYTPRNGIRRKVLGYASVAQIHVSYDDNGARFHDVADYGLGGTHLDNLNSTSCSGEIRATSYTNGDGATVPVNAVCVETESRGYSYVSGSNRQQGEMLKVFSISTIGKYSYIPLWQFNDDGSIEAYIGATGKLQRVTEVPAGTGYDRGWLTKNNVDAKDTYAISHTHNYYWRLDFDIDGQYTANGQQFDNNDIVEEIELRPYDGNRRREVVIKRLTQESARPINRTKMRSWRVRDGAATNSEGQSISYHLEPMDQGHRDLGPQTVNQPLGDVPAWQRNELWTKYDFFVSVAKDCERFATRNFAFTGNDSDALPGNDSCLAFGNLAEYVGIPEFPIEPSRAVKGPESLINQDIVTWYGMSFYHLPRDEDEPYMHAHWSGFKITPRDWHAFNPNANGSSIQLKLNTPNTGDYGFQFGKNSNFNELTANFNGTGVDTLLRVRGYDIDSAGEVEVFLNGKRLARLATTANNTLGRIQQILLPSTKQQAVNTLQFRQRKGGERWGVTDLEIASITGPRLFPQQNLMDTAEYGNKYNGASTHPDAVQISLNNSGVDQTLSVRGFDIDAADEVDVLLNGQRIGGLRVTKNNAEGNTKKFILSQADLNSGENVATVLQRTNGYKWGVTDIAVSDGSGPDVPLSLNDTDKTAYGNKFGTDQHPSRLRVLFANQGRDVNLLLRGYDIDKADEVEVLLNGNSIGFLTAGPNNGMTGIQTIPIPLTAQASGTNTVEFRQTTAGFKWGVRYLRLLPQ